MGGFQGDLSVNIKDNPASISTDIKVNTDFECDRNIAEFRNVLDYCLLNRLQLLLETKSSQLDGTVTKCGFSVTVLLLTVRKEVGMLPKTLLEYIIRPSGWCHNAEMAVFSSVGWGRYCSQGGCNGEAYLSITYNVKVINF